MQKPIILVANGDIRNEIWLKEALDRDTAAIIGVDGGANYLLKQDIVPDIVIGDLDSLSPEHIQLLESNWVNIFSFGRDKDETDLELALLYVVDQPAWVDLPILIYAGLGGRLDHELANLMLLTHPKLINRDIQFIELYQHSFLITGQKEIHGRAGDTISLIPFKGDAHIEMTENLKWPLVDSTLKFGPARGVSNQMMASNCKVVVESGIILCIHTDKHWKR